jgi:tripartite-type tricarboxylate transporter receptor subunit TctC
MSPAGLPPTTLRTLERAFIEAALAPEVRARLVKLGADPVGHGARAFATVLEKDLALWQRVATASGVKVE